MDSELIQFKKVTKRFGKNTVLDSINLTIPEKKITGIIGASGEGKTTILKLLIGFYKPTEGEINYLRRSIFKEMAQINKYFGYATEDGSFYEKLTVRENLFYFGRLYGLKKAEIKQRVEELINLVELQKAVNTLAGNLSIGMKKRLDVACSLIHRPQVLIMDEPTADLDPLLREEMLDLIKKINKDGTTIIITTQILGEFDQICDRIAILYNEKIVEEDKPSKIKSKYRKKDLTGVFNKIFSKRTRKRYHENVKKKTKASEKPKKYTEFSTSERKKIQSRYGEVEDYETISEKELKETLGKK